MVFLYSYRLTNSFKLFFLPLLLLDYNHWRFNSLHSKHFRALFFPTIFFPAFNLTHFSLSLFFYLDVLRLSISHDSITLNITQMQLQFFFHSFLNRLVWKQKQFMPFHLSSSSINSLHVWCFQIQSIRLSFVQRQTSLVYGIDIVKGNH